MPQSKVDLPSLFMVLAFRSNLIVCYFDPFETLGSKEPWLSGISPASSLFLVHENDAMFFT